MAIVLSILAPLPMEVVEEIFKYLDLDDLEEAEKVSQSWKCFKDYFLASKPYGPQILERGLHKRWIHQKIDLDM
ncbi:MAG: F-box protein [Nitrospinaceae bacterium]